MALRTVTGTILKPDGSPWVGAAVAFRLRRASYGIGGVGTPTEVVAITNGAGQISQPLTAQDSPEPKYIAILPGFDTFNFTLPLGDGQPIDLTLLRAAALAPEWAPESLLPFIEDEVDEAVGSGGQTDKTYVHNVAVPSTQVVVVHNLNKWPSVELIDTAGTRYELPSVQYDSLNQLTVNMAVLFSGKIVCN